MCNYKEAIERIANGEDELAISAHYWRTISKKLEKMWDELNTNPPLLCSKYDDCSECPFGRHNRKCLKTRSPRSWMKRTLEKAMGVAEEMATAFDAIQNTP